MLEWLRVGVPTADQDPGPPVVMVDINNVSSYYLNRPFADLAPGKPASITLEKSRRGPTIKVITSSADRRSEVVVSNLQPARRYSVSVRAGNSQGVGPAAPEVSFTTDEDSPSGPPVEVVCRGVTSSTIVVSWSPPDEDVTNGIIVNYRVAYQRLLGSGTASYEKCPLFENGEFLAQYSALQAHRGQTVRNPYGDSRSPAAIGTYNSENINTHTISSGTDNKLNERNNSNKNNISSSSSSSSSSAVSAAGVLVVTEGTTARLVSLAEGGRYRVSVAAATARGVGAPSVPVLCFTAPPRELGPCAVLHRSTA
ncbi:protein sidekick-1-like [Hyalella azteca]|uniref:Protein sidekick-1-like n=1 Tax=Hyalella azteca TaxID=294128 RepID=A0A979FHN4_HYAAZ|nr:protein sidekick-1-like [Hyalella azteca]